MTSIIQKTLNQIPHTVVISRMSDGKLLFANDAAVDFAGLSREQLAEQSSKDYYADPEERTRFVEELRSKGSVKNYKLRMRLPVAKGGGEAWGFVSASVIDFEGEQAILTSVQDLSALYESERQNLQAQNSFRALIENIPDVILILERDGTFSQVREGEPSELARQVLGGGARRFGELLGAGLAEEFQALLEAVLEAGGHESFEFRFHAGGEALSLEARISRMTRDQALLLLRDITGEKKLNNAVAHMERLAAVGRMAAAMAHEIRNPLSVVYTVGQMMESGQVDLGAIERSGKRINSQCERIETIIKDALGYARQGESPEVEVEAVELLQRSLTLARLQFGPAHRRVEVRVEAPQEHLSLRVRVSQIEQVLINLMINAYQALEQGGKMLLRATEDGDGVLLEIEDSGPGIPEDKLAGIFDLFYTTKRTGSGLGLPICKRLVEEHHGSLKAECKGSLGGARFMIRLPKDGLPAGGAAL